MRKQIVAAAAVGLLTGGAAGVALLGPGLAWGQTSTTRPAGPGAGGVKGTRVGGNGLAVAAQAIGISQDDLMAALRDAKSIAQVAKDHNVDPQKVIDALVADGQAGLKQRASDFVNNTHVPGGPKGFVGPGPAPAPGPGPGPGFGFGFGGPGLGHHGPGNDLAVAAQAMGISQQDLMAALHDGKSIAQVAKDHNIDPQKVIDALVADEKSELADAVKAGRITQAQADQKASALVQRVTDLVNNARPVGPKLQRPTS